MSLPSYSCALCTSNTEETMEHLFLHCPSAEACWGLIGVHIPYGADIFSTIDSFKAQLHTPVFMNIVILLCWSI